MFPEYKSNCKGRTPNDPVTLFCMHFLYFTRPEFISFRQMCKELNKPKHQDYRNFIGVKIIKVPSHTALSRFRKKLGLSDSKIDEVNKNVLLQAAGMEGFLNLMICSLDSRPVFAAVGGFKKECSCGTPENCKCKPRFSDKDATVGRQRTKYCGYSSRCARCLRYGTCSKEFTYSFEEQPQFFGPIGQDSELQERMLRFRKQSELNFALESNLLDNVLHHKKLTVRGIKRVETYLKMADIFRLIKGMQKNTLYQRVDQRY